MTRAYGEYGARNGPTTATPTTNSASASPIMPRGVRTAAHSTDAHWWRRIGCAFCGGVLAASGAGGASAVMGYLAILRRGVAISAITSVTMFMTT